MNKYISKFKEIQIKMIFVEDILKTLLLSRMDKLFNSSYGRLSLETLLAISGIQLRS
jgi:hypothetical protein